MLLTVLLVRINRRLRRISTRGYVEKAQVRACEEYFEITPYGYCGLRSQAFPGVHLDKVQHSVSCELRLFCSLRRNLQPDTFATHQVKVKAIVIGISNANPQQQS